MTQFIQLHLLAAYPPANPNRDDSGRPKTALVGGAQRLRISSQALKRAWRTSDAFQVGLGGHLGCRSKELGLRVKQALLTDFRLAEIIKAERSGKPVAYDRAKPSGIKEADANEWAWKIAAVFVDKLKGEQAGEDEPEEEAKLAKGKSKKNTSKSNLKRDTLKSEQMVFYSTKEIENVDSLIASLRATGKAPSDDALAKLKSKESRDADLALFGRMLANSPDFNKEAAAQVANAFTVHKVDVEDDYFTAVDDLKTREQSGSAHISETAFASGLFYLYVCIDADLLRQNLSGDANLAKTTLAALLESAATVAPSGMQNRFANRVRASYILAERGGQQPRSLAVAFFKPIDGDDWQKNAITQLEETRDKMDKIYGACADLRLEANIMTGKGSLQALKEFVRGVYDA